MTPKIVLGRYLGVIFSNYKPIPNDFHSLISKVDGKINSWHNHFLSKIGKPIFIQSHLECTHVPIIWFVLKSRQKYALQLMQLIVNFFWQSYSNSSSLPLVAWSKLCHPRKHEGVNFRKIAYVLISQKWASEYWVIEKIYGPLWCIKNIYRTLRSFLINLNLLTPIFGSLFSRTANFWENELDGKLEQVKMSIYRLTIGVLNKISLKLSIWILQILRTLIYPWVVLFYLPENGISQCWNNQYQLILFEGF